jgi:LCP family protein required for cell wall assembly
MTRSAIDRVGSIPETVSGFAARHKGSLLRRSIGPTFDRLASNTDTGVVRFTIAGLLGLLVPGAGHAYLGRRRAALIFLAPILVILLLLAIVYLLGGFTGLLKVVVTPGVLPALVMVNFALAAWRILAGLDAARRTHGSRLAAGVVAAGIVVLVIVPQFVVGQIIGATSDGLDSLFASGPAATDDGSPAPTEPDDSLVAMTDDDNSDMARPDPWGSGVPAPSATPFKPRTYIGTLPALGVAVPWDRPGANPWGSDGRFDLLLLGSDAGTGRWSRRMDVMLLVEIDVSSGAVAMIGLPRNLVNAPFPPGAARDAVSCGCFKDLLNALYVEATSRHPDRWPGSGTVKGIGAVRSVVSYLTGRPVDAVLVADLVGVIKVVDAMGGVDVTVPASVTDSHYPDPYLGSIALHIPAGKQHFDGRMALAYARSRHQDSDYGRMSRQQTLLLAIRKQIGPATILDAPALFAAAKGMTWTDLPRDSLPALVDLFGKASTASVKQLRIVPSRYAAWLTPSEITTIRKDIAALLGVPVTPTPTPTPTPTLTAGPTPTPSPSPATTAVGDYCGLTLPDATTAIGIDSFTVGTITPSSPDPTWVVSAQGPLPGVLKPVGSTIDLTLSATATCPYP